MALWGLRGYYNQLPELARLIPSGVRRMLHVGYASGTLGAWRKARGPVEVIGIEAVPPVARSAEAVLDRVFIGDVERLDLPYPPSYFDLIIYGDVLEHLRDPWQLLRRQVALLHPNWYVLVVIPNVQHVYVITSLFFGRWTYQAYRLLDWTHLRFFTKREAYIQLEQAGLRVERMERVWPLRRWLNIVSHVCSLYIFQDFFYSEVPVSSTAAIDLGKRLGRLNASTHRGPSRCTPCLPWHA